MEISSASPSSLKKLILPLISLILIWGFLGGGIEWHRLNWLHVWRFWIQDAKNMILSLPVVLLLF
ncbi:hypothetical protein C5167_008200 [Papaver somniferum]|uniref:Uncharacterized protein n=1 Tax=Papaver somniferum TaxID=3469 RepID=A0A4Y7JXR2_PAPSO|nr:hypothetical protein C5167_008200 [Papaver somniferum]